MEIREIRRLGPTTTKKNIKKTPCPPQQKASFGPFKHDVFLDNFVHFFAVFFWCASFQGRGG